MRRSTIFLVLAVVLAILASFWAGGEFVWRKCESSLNRPDTVTITKWVAAPIPEPVTTPVLPKLYLLPVHDTTAVHDTTHTTDSVLVEVPIVEKTYEGENYKATVRGFQPELTSIWVNEKQTIINVPYQKHWTVTVGPQAGFGITPNGWQPYLGGGITFGYSF